VTIDALVKPFLRVPLFQGLKPLQITEIARRADRIVYRPGDVILKENAAGDAAVLIVSGEAVRVTGPEAQQTVCPPEPVPAGALLGEMTMLIDTDHTSTIVAQTTVRALKISRTEIHAQMADDPTLADHFVTKICGRLSELASELRQIDHAFAQAAKPHPAVPRAAEGVNQARTDLH
jgi:CRP-like cAMP-binding protein